eukprot:scaffold773_cov114-Isochrysis_galbana.AAC.12
MILEGRLLLEQLESHRDWEGRDKGNDAGDAQIIPTGELVEEPRDDRNVQRSREELAQCFDPCCDEVKHRHRHVLVGVHKGDADDAEQPVYDLLERERPELIDDVLLETIVCRFNRPLLGAHQVFEGVERRVEAFIIPRTVREELAVCGTARRVARIVLEVVHRDVIRRVRDPAATHVARIRCRHVKAVQTGNLAYFGLERVEHGRHRALQLFQVLLEEACRIVDAQVEEVAEYLV